MCGEGAHHGRTEQRWLWIKSSRAGGGSHLWLQWPWPLASWGPWWHLLEAFSEQGRVAWEGLLLHSGDRPLILPSAHIGPPWVHPLGRTQFTGAGPRRHSRTELKRLVRTHSLPVLTLKSKMLALPTVGEASSSWGHTRACCSGTTQASLGSQWGLSGDKVPLAQLSVPAHGHSPRAFEITQFGKTNYSDFPPSVCDSKAFVCLRHPWLWPRLGAGVLEAEAGALRRLSSLTVNLGSHSARPCR